MLGHLYLYGAIFDESTQSYVIPNCKLIGIENNKITLKYGGTESVSIAKEFVEYFGDELSIKMIGFWELLKPDREGD